MKFETNIDLRSATRLTPQYLQKLIDGGFRYVQIKSYSWDRRQDYMTPHYFILTPIKDLSDNKSNREIYEPIDSQILKEWSKNPEDGIAVLVSKT